LPVLDRRGAGRKIVAMMIGRAWRCGLAVAVMLVAAQPAVADPRYRLAVDLDPVAGRIGVAVRMAGLECSAGRARLWLNRDLMISRVEIDGRAVPPPSPVDAGGFWLSSARAIDLPCPRRDARLVYAGPGTLHPDGRNQVSPRLVELSLYGAWYPLQRIDQHTLWRLNTRLPPGWRLATPGRVTRSGPALVITARRASDIVLLAAPGLAETPASPQSARVLLDAAASPAERATAAALGREAAASVAAFTALLGPAGRQPPELVFTPRSGPLSYARLPLIVTPRADLTAPGGRSLMLTVRHEVAHFWSRARGEADDWLNEGLAEYLAVRRGGDTEGAAVRDGVLADYRREVAAAGPGRPIRADGPDRELINRYYRPALLLDALERRFGRPAVDRLLRVTLAGTGTPTSAGFLAAAGRELGDGAAILLTRCLAAPDWPADCGGS
jgi:hypothetical protein